MQYDWDELESVLDKRLIFMDSFAAVIQDRLPMENKSHATEIIQRTRLELENGDISKDEIDAAIRVSLQKNKQHGSFKFEFSSFISTGVPFPPKTIGVHDWWTRLYPLGEMGMVK